MIHPLSDVKSPNIGKNTQIWQYAIVLEGAIIGENCNINSHTFIENNVLIGNNVTVKSGVYLWDGMVIGDNVFIGPNVTFTNDKYPRSKKYPGEFQSIKISPNASVGAGSIIMGGITIGRFALIAAGSLVTRDIPDFALVVGSPAETRGWVDEEGNKMQMRDGIWYSKDGRLFKEENNVLKQI